MKLKKKFVIAFSIIFALVITGIAVITVNKYLLTKETPEKPSPEPETTVTSITISAVGDCTLGSDSKVGPDGWNSFNSYLKDNDYGYYFRGVYDILKNDDLTIANLEGTFTEATEKAVKTFNFKNSKDYVNVLTEGSIEIVNTANNHTYDYKEQGYEDTIATLNAAGISYFGYTTYKVEEVNGIKIGFAGLNYYDEKNYENYKSEVDEAITYLKEQNGRFNYFYFPLGNRSHL